MQLDHVTLEYGDGIAVLTLKHEEVMNALSLGMMADLNAALDDIGARKADTRCLVLTGAGKAFCTGLNLAGGVNDLGSTDPGALLRDVYHPFILRLRDLHCPIIAAVNGPAAGAGMSLAMLGDIILCSQKAYFLQAFRHVGVVPDCGSTWTLPRLVGRARAAELALFGDRLEASKALEWGLVNGISAPNGLMSEAMAMAARLAKGPPIALSLMRRLAWSSAENSFERQLEAEQEAQSVAGTSQDFREGVMAFIGRRPANFVGA